MNNNYALILGVGPGLGLALAKKFYSKGLNICLVARNMSKLASIAEEFKDPGKGVFIYAADAGNRESILNTMGGILQDLGTPSVAIYNVSLLRPGEPSHVDYNTFVRDFEINVGGLLTMYQALIGLMRKEGKGKILVTGGGLSLSPFFEFASLGVGKAGLRNLVGSLAQECGKWGIQVSTITINGMIKPGTKFDPENIAEKFWEVYETGLATDGHEYIFE
jgi:short-subunit dehydrogenase